MYSLMRGFLITLCAILFAACGTTYPFTRMTARLHRRGII